MKLRGDNGNGLQGTKIFQYCTCPAGRKTYNFHSSCKHMHLSFKSVCNKEHKRVICNMTSSSNSSQIGKNYLPFLDFTRNYERTSGIFVPWPLSFHHSVYTRLGTYVASKLGQFALYVYRCKFKSSSNVYSKTFVNDHS